jgi:hypothetical protein
VPVQGCRFIHPIKNFSTVRVRVQVQVPVLVPVLVRIGKRTLDQSIRRKCNARTNSTKGSCSMGGQLY